MADPKHPRRLGNEFKAHPGKPNEADLSNLVAREFCGRM